MKKPEVRHFPNPESMSLAAASQVAGALSCAVRHHGFASLVLSGGATPRKLYELLASEEFAGRLPWEKICFFWGDERCVSAGDPDSNYGSAFQLLLSRIPADPGQIYRIPVELGWQQSAQEYSSAVGEFLHEGSCGFRGPAGFFDIVLLGVGEDGHTASLFPGSDALEKKIWAAAVKAPRGVSPRNRITLTPAALNKGRQVLFMASAGKRDIVRRVFESGGGGGGDLPAAKIKGREETIVLISD